MPFSAACETGNLTVSAGSDHIDGRPARPGLLVVTRVKAAPSPVGRQQVGVVGGGPGSMLACLSGQDLSLG